jgi:hypothetical protein
MRGIKADYRTHPLIDGKIGEASPQPAIVAVSGILAREFDRMVAGLADRTPTPTTGQQLAPTADD